MKETGDRSFAERPAETLERRFGLNGEYEKTEEDLRFDEASSEWIRAEMRRLSVDRPIEFGPDRVHFVSTETARKMQKKEPDGLFETLGFYLRESGDAYAVVDAIARRPNPRLQLHETVLHEKVHAFGYRPAERRGSPDAPGYRTGYHTEKGRLGSVNEAVVTQIGMDLLLANGASFGHRRTDVRRAAAYPSDRVMLKLLVDGLARETGRRPVEELDLIKRQYFNGQMMQLRMIDRVFGEHTLRIISGIAPSELRQREIAQMVRTLLTSPSPETRREAIQDLTYRPEPESFTLY